MGTITAGAVLDKASIQLFDVPNVRWTRAELLNWLSMGQRTLILAVPEASAATGTVTLVSGTKQSIPADGWMLFSANRNLGPSGNVPGQTLEPITRDILTRNNPTWSSVSNAAATQTAYFYTPLDKQVWWCYPPADSSGNKIEVTYSVAPTTIASEATTLLVNDMYEPVLLDYILFRACSKDAEYAPGMQLAQMYMQSFTAALTALKGSTREAPAEAKAA
jgi:hypothetical protein